MLSDDEAKISKASPVSLVEITAGTVRSIAALQVAPSQRNFVASNVLSMAEANFDKGAWFRAIHAGETAVGFVMLQDSSLPGASPVEDSEASDIWLWRFMIAEAWQKHGFGRQALDKIVEHARSRPGMTRLLASYVPGPGCPRDFYLKYGFRETGRTCADGTEKEIALAL